MTTMTPEDTIKAASSVARDIADGRLSPSVLADQAVAECRALFGEVVGDGDPLWDLHRDIARQTIALGALTADELSEWAAVFRHPADEATAPAPVAMADDTPPDPVSLASVAHSPETVPSDDTDDTEPAVVAVADAVPQPAVSVVQPPTSPRPDHYDATAAWLAGNTRRN